MQALYPFRRHAPAQNVTSAKNLPAKSLTLHREILTLRHKVLAHTDLTLKEAKVYVTSHKGRPIVTVLRNISPLLPDREDVITLIERTLDQMYDELERLKKALVPKN